MPTPALYITQDRILALPNVFPPGYMLMETDLARIDQDIATAGEAINRACGRHFDLIAADTRAFDAPAATHLDIADLQPSPAPVVTFAGDTLVAGTDYVLRPQITALAPAYTQIVRVRGGFVARWGYRPVQRSSVVSVPISRGGIWDEYLAPASPYGGYAPAPSEQVITITGTWGYSATVPGPIAQAVEILVLRLMQSRTVWFAKDDNSGAPVAGSSRGQTPLLITRDVLDLIAPYIKPASAEATDE